MYHSFSRVFHNAFRFRNPTSDVLFQLWHRGWFIDINPFLRIAPQKKANEVRSWDLDGQSMSLLRDNATKKVGFLCCMIMIPLLKPHVLQVEIVSVIEKKSASASFYIMTVTTSSALSSKKYLYYSIWSDELVICTADASVNKSVLNE